MEAGVFPGAIVEVFVIGFFDQGCQMLILVNTLRLYSGSKDYS